MSISTTKSSIDSIPVTNTLYWSVYYSSLTNRINYYFLAIAVPIGCVLNLMAIAVFSRKRLNQNTMGFFNKCLAVSNIFTLIFSFLMYSGLYFPVDLLTYSTATCRFISYSRKQIRMISPWIQTIFTFDLFLNVTYPNKFTFLKTKRNILLVILVMILVLLGLNVLNAFYFATVVKTPYISVKNESLVWSKKSCKGSDDIEMASNIILDFVRCFIPFAIMTVLSALIILKVRRSSKKTANANQTGQTVSSREVRQNQFAITLVLTNMLFMLFNFPVSISHIWMDVYFYHMEGDGGMTGILLTFAWSMGLVISTAHYVIFFFINLFGNRLFRNEMKAMLENKDLSQILGKNHSLISSTATKRAAAATPAP